MFSLNECVKRKAISRDLFISARYNNNALDQCILGELLYNISRGGPCASDEDAIKYYNAAKAEGLIWLNKAIDQKCVRAVHALSHEVWDTVGVHYPITNDGKSLSQLHEWCAEMGCQLCKWMIATLYASGKKGYSKSYQKCMYWCENILCTTTSDWSEEKGINHRTKIGDVRAMLIVAYEALKVENYKIKIGYEQFLMLENKEYDATYDYIRPPRPQIHYIQTYLEHAKDMQLIFLCMILPESLSCLIVHYCKYDVPILDNNTITIGFDDNIFDDNIFDGSMQGSNDPTLGRNVMPNTSDDRRFAAMFRD